MADDHQLHHDRKTALRQELIAIRRARSTTDRLDAARANAAHLISRLAGCDVVCGYLPLASEPLTTDLLDHLLASGITVLVPVVTGDSALDWCRYPSPTRPGVFGIAEPTGPRLGPESIRIADAVLVPALAVAPDGHRLGRGGGHYDRTLALVDPPGPGSTTTGPLLVAVLFDGEILPGLPSCSHDIAVGAVTTPSDGIRYLHR